MTNRFTAIALLLFVGLLVMITEMKFAGWLSKVVPWLYLAASVVTFIAYAIDKSAAKHDRWRTRESTLHLFAVVGGWPGALLAQRALRHKSRKKSFQVVFWITVVINCSVLAWLLLTVGEENHRFFG